MKKDKKELSEKTEKSKRRILLIISIVSFSINMVTPVYAANDPLSVINNLSDFMFGLIRAIGMIITGYAIAQIGFSFTTHDPSQRANGFMFVAGGLLITFSKEILNLITG